MASTLTSYAPSALEQLAQTAQSADVSSYSPPEGNEQTRSPTDGEESNLRSTATYENSDNTRKLSHSASMPNLPGLEAIAAAAQKETPLRSVPAFHTVSMDGWMSGGRSTAPTACNTEGTRNGGYGCDISTARSRVSS
jgi:hypothetical protein